MFTKNIFSFAVGLLILILFGLQSETYAAPSVSKDEGSCLECHGDKGLSTKLKNGDALPLYVNSSLLKSSVHTGFPCTNCHLDFSSEKHSQKEFKDRREFTMTASLACTQCHSFEKGIHQGMANSLVCVDCHGSHNIQPRSHDKDSCLTCHQGNIILSFTDGSSQPISVKKADLEKSVHAKLRCVDCHFGFSTEDHPKRKFVNKRNLTIMASESCRRCHFDKYTQTLESIHYNLLDAGLESAPVCIDCHGAHAIQSGRQEKLVSARKCQNCHPEIYETYTKSVHGNALLSEHNQDVPICSDCHSAHRITDPRLVDFRNEIPQMCGNCHADEGLMQKYGLSTSVLQSYLEDFHGVTLTFYKKQDKPVRHIAVCVDCHGIHDITKAKGPKSSLVKSRLLERCQKCHPYALSNFPDSWISHYEPTIKRAPLVLMVTLFYKIFIPFMIIGLVLQIFLHIWRYAVNR